jgi:predicted Zn-dependent protease
MRWLHAKQFGTSINKHDERIRKTATEDAGSAEFARDPDLPVAHSLYAQLEVDLGRAEDAMRRFLDRLGDRPRDAQIYGGLVQALRFCSLLDASLAAHHTARHLDANVVTSVHHTWWMRGK